VNGNDRRGPMTPTSLQRVSFVLLLALILYTAFSGGA
jgi:hypothetical protein